MNIGGKEIRFKKHLKVYQQAYSYDLAQLHDQLVEWIQNKDRTEDELGRLAGWWSELLPKIVDNPEDLPPFGEAGVTVIKEAVDHFFGIASITKQSGD